MDYADFKKMLLDELNSNEATKNFKFQILNAGYSVKDAIKDNFPITKTGAEFLEWVNTVNMRYYGRPSDMLIDDILLVETKERASINFLAIKALYEKYTTIFNYDFIEFFNTAMIEFVNISETPARDIYVKHSDDYEIVKKILIIRPLAKEEVEEKTLKEAIYDEFNDILLVLYADLSGDNTEIVLSSKILKSTFDSWKQKKEDVMYDALVNTYVLAQPRMFNVLDLDGYMGGKKNVGAFMAINEDPRCYKYNTNSPFLLTTTRRKNGAIAIFYPNVKEKIADIVGGDFYFLIGDIDTCFILNAAWDDDKLKMELSALTAGGSKEECAQNGFDAYLSKYLYKYDSKRNEISIHWNIEEIDFD